MSLTLQRLLDRAGATHRGALAAALDAPDATTTAALRDAILDPHGLRARLTDCTEQARSLLGELVFTGAGRITTYPWSPSHDDGARDELERIGVVFVYEVGGHWGRQELVVADDALEPVAAALVTLHVPQQRDDVEPAHVVAAPLQAMHDAAVLAAALRREPARLKADGTLYQRAWPRLQAALSDAPTALGTTEHRASLALGLLAEAGAVRPRVQRAVTGRSATRELTVAADAVAALLELPADAARAKIVHAHGEPMLAPLANAVASALAGRTVSVEQISDIAASALLEAKLYCDSSDESETIAEALLGPHLLAGLVQACVDARGQLCAIRFEPVQVDGGAGHVVCQSSFEIVLLGPVTARQAHDLELCCERAPDQAHVLRLTKASVQAAAGAGVLASELLAHLGADIPQNVAQSLAGWEGSIVRGRVRSALFVELDDAATCERLLSGPLASFEIARLTDTMLAIRHDDLAKVRTKLRAAGVLVEAGVEHVSGPWSADDHDELRALEAGWSHRERARSAPQGTLRSGLTGDRREHVAPASGVARRRRRPRPGAADIAQMLAMLDTD